MAGVVLVRGAGVGESVGNTVGIAVGREGAARGELVGIAMGGVDGLTSEHAVILAPIIISKRIRRITILSLKTPASHPWQIEPWLFLARPAFEPGM